MEEDQRGTSDRMRLFLTVEAELDPLALARSRLQQQQRRWPSANSTGMIPIEVARERSRQRQASSFSSKGYIKSGRFLYDPSLERQRWQRTDEVVERAKPGHDEDGTLLEHLARQAASVELYLCSQQFPTEVGEATERILVGTTSASLSHAGCFQVRNVVLLTFSAGLLTLLAVLAHAVVRAHAPLSPESRYSRFSTQEEQVERHLDEDSSAVDLVERFLTAWLVAGRADTVVAEQVPDHLLMPHELLLTFAERFVVAHEYSHALVDKMQLQGLGGEASPGAPAIEKEVRADLFGVATLGRTAQRLDGTAPNVALQGAVLAMKAHELVERARGLGAASPRLQHEQMSHPPFQQRAALCRDVYRWFIRQGTDPRSELRGMTVPAETAERIYRRAEPAIRTAIQAKGLHPVWRNN